MASTGPAAPSPNPTSSTPTVSSLLPAPHCRKAANGPPRRSRELKEEYADTLTPARDAAANIHALERKLSDLVNAAYGLTPEEVALMWRTAPPRMPLDPTEELRRIAGAAPIAA